MHGTCNRVIQFVTTLKKLIRNARFCFLNKYCIVHYYKELQFTIKYICNLIIFVLCTLIYI